MDGFLGGEIRFRISCSIGKSGFRILQSNEKSVNGFHLRKSVPRVDVNFEKSKSGFPGFPFYRSNGKSEKGFAKLLS